MDLLPLRSHAGRRTGAAGLLVAALAGVLVLTLAGYGRSPGTTGAETEQRSGRETQGAPSRDALGAPGPRGAGSPYRLLVMNLCLSGMAGCYDQVAYPAVVREAVARIRERAPHAVAFNEACRRDVQRIARRTGYHLRFARVIYGGERLRCVDPGRRGLFGVALLTRAPVLASRTRPFEAQAGPEQRRWVCVSTRRLVEVCTAHLESRRIPGGPAANDEQCRELAALLARRSSARAVAFGGDVNRRRSCAPDRAWTRTDRSAEQAPGLQHVYGSRPRLRFPAARVVRARHTDHDVLVVRARLLSR